MKHLYSVTVWRERGEEKERQQKNQVSEMENRLEESEREADRTETKLSLMESVLGKLKGKSNFGGRSKGGYECRRFCVQLELRSCTRSVTVAALLFFHFSGMPRY